MKWLGLLVLALLALAFLRWAFVPSARLPRYRVRVMRLRLRLRLHPGRGHATAAELHWQWGRLASFRGSRRSRPSLTFWQRLCCTCEHAVYLGRAQYRHRVHVPVEEHLVCISPPRKGKTAWLATVIQAYPGPVLSTTTKADVFGWTSGVRARRGPVHVFNPQGIGGVPSTFRWSPVDGAQDPAVAIRRADGFANAIHVDGENAFFQNAARGYLRAMFHAAALVGGDMRLVSRWALTGTKGGAVEAENILREHGADLWADELSQLRGKAERTNATNEMVLTQALGFMADPALALSVLPCPDGPFDMEAFLADRGTLYMIADSPTEDSPLAPLFAAMASDLHYTAVMLGQASPGGRLDPPLLMALDEIVQVCPVPLPTWAADSGGKGIQIISVTHGEAQLASRWGEHGKQIILDTTGALVVLPGIQNPVTLDTLSKLCGQAAQREKGQDSHSRHDVMTPAMIRQLLKWHALIIRGGCAPVIVKLPRIWRTSQYRTARQRGYATAALRPAPAILAEPHYAEWDPNALELAELSGGAPPPDGTAGGDGLRPWWSR